MKKIISSTFILAAMAVAFTGCLKDKGFENHTYGINDPDTQPPAVGFPLATSDKYTVGLDAGSATLQVAKNVLFVDIFAGKAPKSDVQVTLTPNDNLRTAYNTANGTSMLAMPAAYYNIPSLTITIPAGQLNATVPINIPTTVPMDPNNSYALGFTISAVTGGYSIPANFKNLLIEFSLKNKYDGFYQITSGTCVDANGIYGGYYPGSLYYDPTDPRYYSLSTQGPVSGLFYDEWFPYANYIVQNLSSGGFANTGIRPILTFDPATDKVASVTNFNNLTQVFTVGANSRFNNSDHSIDLDWTLGRWHVTEHWKYIRAR